MCHVAAFVRHCPSWKKCTQETTRWRSKLFRTNLLQADKSNVSSHSPMFFLAMEATQQPWYLQRRKLLKNKRSKCWTTIRILYHAYISSYFRRWRRDCGSYFEYSRVLTSSCMSDAGAAAGCCCQTGVSPLDRACWCWQMLPEGAAVRVARARTL